MSLSIRLDYEKYGLKREEVLEWGKKNYPELANNEYAIYVLYLRKVKNISVFRKTKRIETGEARRVKIKDLVAGELLEIEGRIIDLIRESVYEGCPKCHKKFIDGRCPSGHNEEPIKIRWVEYAIADDTGYVTLVIPPFSDINVEIEGRYIVRGLYNGKDAFSARLIMKVEEEPKMGEEAEVVKGLLTIMENETIDEFKAYVKKKGLKINVDDIPNMIKKFGYDIVNGVVKKVEK
jgi:hypothetical protein